MRDRVTIRNSLVHLRLSIANGNTLMPSPEHEAVVAALADADIAEAPSLEEQRANYEAMLGAVELPADVDVQELTIEHANADWVSTPGCAQDRAILYFHGGGYVIGSNVAYREFAGRLSRATGARVLVLNYRLAPEHPFPAAVDDATMAYRWLLNEGYAASKLTIAGDSAGGGLTLAALVSLRDGGTELPGCGVCLSPWADLQGTGASSQPGAVSDPLVTVDGLVGMSGSYAPNDLTNPLASPLHADYTGLPPLLLQVGTREILLDDTTRVAEKAQAAGVDVTTFMGEGLIHVWPVLVPTAPESVAALEQIGEFIGKHAA